MQPTVLCTFSARLHTAGARRFGGWAHGGGTLLMEQWGQMRRRMGPPLWDETHALISEASAWRCHGAVAPLRGRRR